jgi:hypothetical protein
MHVTEVSLEGNILSFFCGDGIDCCISNGSQLKSYIYSSTNYWIWDFGSFLGHLWCFCPSDLCSCLGEISSLWSNLRDMDFSFYLWRYCCFFLGNSTTSWRSILLLIIVSSRFLCLFYKVTLFSSLEDWDIRIVFLVVPPFRRDVCRVQRPFVFNEPPSYYLFFFVLLSLFYLFLLFLWWCSF